MTYYDSQPDESGETHKIPDEKTKRYLKAKEKTVSDTVIFKGDTESAIKNIISFFESLFLKSFMADRIVKNFYLLMMAQRNFNLRTFAFACQKTIDICEELRNIIKMVDYFVMSIFLE